jgi:hypothetical protein
MYFPPKVEEKNEGNISQPTFRVADGHIQSTNSFNHLRVHISRDLKERIKIILVHVPFPQRKTYSHRQKMQNIMFMPKVPPIKGK